MEPPSYCRNGLEKPEANCFGVIGARSTRWLLWSGACAAGEGAVPCWWKDGVELIVEAADQRCYE